MERQASSCSPFDTRPISLSGTTRGGKLRPSYVLQKRRFDEQSCVEPEVVGPQIKACDYQISLRCGALLFISECRGYFHRTHGQTRVDRRR